MGGMAPRPLLAANSDHGSTPSNPSTQPSPPSNIQHVPILQKHTQVVPLRHHEPKALFAEQ